MKIRLLEKELQELGYQLKPKRGKGNHRIFKHYLTRKTLIVSGKRGKDAQPYQLKFLRPNLELSTL